MQMVLDLAPVIGTIISAHCPGTGAKEEFLRACVHGHWDEATAMVEGMLAEPWHLQGYRRRACGNFSSWCRCAKGWRRKNEARGPVTGTAADADKTA
jgi:hypothetical protein